MEPQSVFFMDSGSPQRKGSCR
ncbi:BnaA03g59860D [Brassica napus]|uniref:BnaA03g59860D protein n=1 Tax=Brassica napus TaxID=3708 RepID=A0A078GI55_BRANA|nr:BnaA03g59860D [Brassica napus]